MHDLTTWGMTAASFAMAYLLFSTWFLLMAWLLERARVVRHPVLGELMWKSAAVLPIVAALMHCGGFSITSWPAWLTQQETAAVDPGSNRTRSRACFRPVYRTSTSPSPDNVAETPSPSAPDELISAPNATTQSKARTK